METLENIIKKFVYTGVGIVAITKEKFEKAIDDLVKDDKLSSDEGKRIVEDFLKGADLKKDEFEGHMKSVIEKTVSKFSFATKSDLEGLTKRIEELEAFVAAKESPKTDQPS